MKRKTVQTKYDVPVRRAFRWASEQKFCEAELHEIFRIPAPWLTKEIIFVCTVFLLFTLWMTSERMLIFAQFTLWSAPQNLQFTLWNSGYGMSAYKWRQRLNVVILNALWFVDHKRAHFPEFKLWLLPLVTWIDGFPQPEYCMLHSLGLIKNRTDLFSGFWERPVLRKQTLRFQKTM